MNKLILFLCIVLLPFAYSCNGSKKSAHSSKTVPTYCDTIKKYVDTHKNLFTPVILNIDTNFQVFTTKNGEDDCYQLKFKYLRGCDQYKIWFDDILFDFTLNNNDCILIGDEVNCYVNELTLGKECQTRYGSEGNCFDCIWHKKGNWTIKVCGNFCGQFIGPVGILENVSLQCSDR